MNVPTLPLPRHSHSYIRYMCPYTEYFVWSFLIASTQGSAPNRYRVIIAAIYSVHTKCQALTDIFLLNSHGNILRKVCYFLHITDEETDTQKS